MIKNLALLLVLIFGMSQITQYMINKNHIYDFYESSTFDKVDDFNEKFIENITLSSSDNVRLSIQTNKMVSITVLIDNIIIKEYVNINNFNYHSKYINTHLAIKGDLNTKMYLIKKYDINPVSIVIHFTFWLIIIICIARKIFI